MSADEEDLYDLRKAAQQLDAVFKLLCCFNPLEDRSDVTWQGPYYIERPRAWHASYFVLYDGTLYVSLEWRGGVESVSWLLGAEAIRHDHSLGSGGQSVPWVAVFKQLEARLLSAKRNALAYNRRVAKYIPLTCRHGKIKRAHLWVKGNRLPIAEEAVESIKRFIDAHAEKGYRQITLREYLSTTALAYDTMWEEQAITPLERYKKHADGRDAGLLKLPPDGAREFEQWYEGSERLGAHPWEIIYGNPHGIMLPVSKDEKTGLWRYHLWAGAVGWYSAVAKIAAAFVERGIVFDIVNKDAVFSALKGEDEVEVSPVFGLESISIPELEEGAPEAIARVQWEALPELTYVSSEQRERIEQSMARRLELKQ